MIDTLANLIGAVAAVVLILAAVVYIVSPKHGGELLRRLAIFLAGALVGLCLLRQYTAWIGPLSVVLVGLVVVIAAYFIRESCRNRSPRPVSARRGAERMPVLPQHEEEGADE